MEEDLKQVIGNAGQILIGIGGEWSAEKKPEVRRAYDALNGLIKDKDYFIVTTVTDGTIYESGLNADRITAPCGNLNWKQCSRACTKDIWEAFEVPGGICPHCKAPLVGNTIKAEHYIEEGYLPKWQAYTAWLSKTLNHDLLILELGEGFLTPTVIRWPFEKTAFINKKAMMYRVNQSYSQSSEELKDRMVSISEDSCELFIKFDKI